MARFKAPSEWKSADPVHCVFATEKLARSAEVSKWLQNATVLGEYCWTVQWIDSTDPDSNAIVYMLWATDPDTAFAFKMRWI